MLKNPNIYYKPIGGIDNEGFKFYENDKQRSLKDLSFYLKLKEILFPKQDTKLDPDNDLILKRIAYVYETPKYQSILKFIFVSSDDSFENYKPDLDDLKLYVKHFERLKFIDRDVIFLDFEYKDFKEHFFVDKNGESLLLQDMYTIQTNSIKSRLNLKITANKVQLLDFDFKNAGFGLDYLIQNTPRRKPYSEFIRDFSLAFIPLIQVLSCIEAESGIKQKYKKPWENFEEFKIYLDPSAVKKIGDTYETEKSKVKIDPEDMRERIGAQTLQEFYSSPNPPGINFSQYLTEPALQYLLDLPATYGALQMAANDLGFKLWDLIRSPEVNFLFAQFVARKWISPKQTGFVSGVNGNQRQFRISSGLQVAMSNEKWLMGCKKVFKHQVYLSKHPDCEKKYQLIRNLIDPFRLDDIPESTDDFDNFPQFDKIRSRRDLIFQQRMELRAMELDKPPVLRRLEN